MWLSDLDHRIDEERVCHPPTFEATMRTEIRTQNGFHPLFLSSVFFHGFNHRLCSKKQLIILLQACRLSDCVKHSGFCGCLGQLLVEYPPQTSRNDAVVDNRAKFQA